MSTFILVGNGESRQQFDLERLVDIPVQIVGCNALYREFVPHILVAVDPKMVVEIESAKYREPFIKSEKVGENWLIWDRKRYVKGKPWAAGPLAVWYLCQYLSAKCVYLLGFDLYGIEGKVNNVYKGTQNYLPFDATAEPCFSWIKQLGEVFASFPKIAFRRVGNVGDAFPERWKGYDNIVFISYEQFSGELDLEGDPSVHKQKEEESVRSSQRR